MKSWPNLREAYGALHVGAAAHDFVLETSPLIGERCRLIADTSAVVAEPVVRQMGTLVGSLCNNDSAGEWPVTALASRAQVVVQGKGGARTVAIDDFIVDSFTTAVGTGKLAGAVRFPTPGTRTSGSFQKLERKVGDFATASAAAQITLDNDGTAMRRPLAG